jgi:hypothetical protein
MEGGMKRTKLPMVVAFSLAAIVVGGYFACYARLGETWSGRTTVDRTYPSESMTKWFIAAAWIEANVLSKTVSLVATKGDPPMRVFVYQATGIAAQKPKHWRDPNE